MEIFALILMLIATLAAFVGVISLVVLIIQLLVKKNVKKTGIVTGSSFGLMFLSVVVFMIIAVVGDYGNEISVEETADATNNYEGTYSKPNQNVDTSRGDDNEPIEDDEDNVIKESEEESEFDKNLAEIQNKDKDLETEDIELEEDEEKTEEPKIDPNDLSNYRTDYDIKDIERNPEEYKDELFSFEGKIIQVLEDDIYTSYRIAINDDYDRIVYVQTFTTTLEGRFLEDDYVTVYGMFTDLLTYETVLGANQTIPAFLAAGNRIVLQ